MIRPAFELAHFTVRDGEEADLIAERAEMLRALRRSFPAARAAWLTKQDDGSWLDVILWSSREAAEEAAQRIGALPEARTWFWHIGESHSLRHVDVVHEEIFESNTGQEPASGTTGSTGRRMMSMHRTGTREEWLAARKVLLDAEKAHMRRGDEIARMRQQLPWVAIDKEYVFDTDEGEKTLADLFDGRSQLLVYHFMFGFGARLTEERQGCTGCSLVADHFDGVIPHLNGRDITLVCASLAPLDQLRDYKRKMGWRFPWVSSLGSDFNYDCGVAFTKEQQRNGAEYNFRHVDKVQPQREGMSAFARQYGVVHHTYSTNNRGVEALMGTYQFLDLAPLGRNEDGLDFPQAWWRRHDEYAASTPDAPTDLGTDSCR